MSRALGPRPPFAAGNAALAWMLITTAWGLAGLAWLAWAAARMPPHWPAAGSRRSAYRWLAAVLHGRTAQAWPGTPTPLVSGDRHRPGRRARRRRACCWRIIARRITRPGDPVAALSAGPVHPPAHPRPRHGDRRPAAGCRWPAAGPAAWPPPTSGCCSAA